MEREVARLQAGVARHGLPWLEGEIGAKRKEDGDAAADATADGRRLSKDELAAAGMANGFPVEPTGGLDTDAHVHVFARNTVE